MDIQLSPLQVNYVLDELEGYAALRDTENRCQASAFDRIWEAQALLDVEKSSSLQRELAELILTVKPEKDGVTTNVVDPNLYPLVYNRTLVSQLNGRRYRPVPPPPRTDIYTLSSTFQHLPTDVFVRNNGNIKILSYINNLPLKYKATYSLLQDLLAKFIPLFEHTLTDLHRNNPMHQRIQGPSRYTVWDEPEPPEHSDDDQGWVEYEREMREWAISRPISLPDVRTSGYPGGLEKRRHIVKLRDRLVQVITRVVHISLEPGGRTFEGSDWHVEGMRGERIVACGVHCLSKVNVSDSYMDFRMAVSYPRGFSAGDNGATMRTWGIRDGDPCHQYIGQVPIRQGLSLVFPNIYQSRQSTFNLVDQTKEGHLTTIWFMLVDPDIPPIISTRLVAPQQKEWIHVALDQSLDPRLPSEIVELILQQVDGLTTKEEAAEYRKMLLKGLEAFTHASNTYHFCIPFDIWNGPELLPS